MARGHIQQRENGTFRVLIYARRDPLTGKERRRTATAYSRKEAEQLGTRLLSEIDPGRTGGGSKATLSRVLERWLETTDLELTTRYCCEQHIASKILPALGDVPPAGSPSRRSTASTPSCGSAAGRGASRWPR